MKYIKTKKYDLHLLERKYDYKRNFSCYIRTLNMFFIILTSSAYGLTQFMGSDPDFFFITLGSKTLGRVNPGSESSHTVKLI